ncbi:MAG: hypothetical protein GC134_04305 [Proteobacteria bacterium]|nr:hypothetical protein [Pseudomonadota bacterium]
MPGWEVFALLASLASAVTVQINRYYRLEGAALVLLRSIFLVAIVAPFAAAVPWPDYNEFYILAVVVGMMGLFADVVLFNAAATYGGRLTSLYMAIKILGGFFLWSFIDKGFLPALMVHPGVFAGVMACLALSALAMMVMRRNDVSWAALLAILPAGLMLTLADSASKVAMQGAEVLSGSIVYTFMLGLVSLVGTSLWYALFRRRALRTMFTRRSLTAGAATGAAFAVMLGAMTAAVAQSPNPAYVNVLALMSMVWLMIYLRLRKEEDEANPVAGLMFVASAAGIILLVSS